MRISYDLLKLVATLIMPRYDTHRKTLSEGIAVGISNDRIFVCGSAAIGFIFFLDSPAGKPSSRSMILSAKKICWMSRVTPASRQSDSMYNQSITTTMEIAPEQFEVQSVWPACGTRSWALMDDHRTATLARLKLSFARTEHDGCGAL